MKTIPTLKETWRLFSTNFLLFMLVSVLGIVLFDLVDAPLETWADAQTKLFVQQQQSLALENNNASANNNYQIEDVISSNTGIEMPTEPTPLNWLIILLATVFPVSILIFLVYYCDKNATSPLKNALLQGVYNLPKSTLMYVVAVVAIFLPAILFVLVFEEPMAAMLSGQQSQSGGMKVILMLAWFLLAMLFIVVLSIRLSFCFYYYLLERSTLIDAFKRSWASTRPYYWLIIRGYLILMIIISLMTGIATEIAATLVGQKSPELLYVIQIFFGSLMQPIMTLFTYVIYQNIKNEKQQTAQETKGDGQGNIEA